MHLKSSDHRLLNALQEDANKGPGELAESAGLSRTSCWRRIKEFESSGLISKRVTLLDPKELGYNIHVFLSVKLVRHSEENSANFEKYLESLPNVLQCFSVSGETDYILYVVEKDMDSYADFLSRKVLQHPLVSNANSKFALRRIKYTTALPVE